MPDVLTAANLEDCDVLLYRGRTWLGRAIQLFDTSDVNHAGIYLREGAVAEATGRGVERRPLATSIAKNEWVLSRRLRTRPRSLVAVRLVADRTVARGHRYAYEQIVLLAFLCLTRRLPWGPGLEGVVRGTLDSAASWLAGLARGAREPMICSEFAFRCYEGAGPGRSDRYSLAIGLRGAAKPARRAGARRIASSPRQAGRIDSESLIAQVARSLKRRLRTRSVSPRATPPSAATLRKRFEAYEAALRSHRSLGETLRLDAPIEASIERFAIAWTGTETARAVQAKNSRAQERTTASSSRKALAARTPLARLEAAAADFVTPGDLLHSASLVTVGQVAVPAPKRRRAKRAARKPMPRTTLTRAEVEREIVTMLAKLAPGWKTSDITSTTRLEQDFGFDEWGILRVVPPIRRRFQIDVPDGLVRRARTVGDLVKLVWDRLEDAP